MVNKKIIIVVLAIILAGVGAWYFVGRPSIGEILSPIGVSPAGKTAEPVASVGWSTTTNEEQAVKEAVTMVLGELKKNPDFAFVYCASGYQEEKILTEVRRLLPGTKIIGGNSGYGVMTTGGYFWYPVAAQSIGILGVVTPKITWGVGIVPVNGISARDAAKRAVLAAIKDAGKKETEKPKLVFSVPSFGIGVENVLKGIADAVGADVPVFGAYSVDKGAAGDWRTFANDNIYHDAAAIAVVYTDLKIGYFREHGFEVTEQGGIVTKVEKNRLIEIDGRPAAEAYNELTGGIFEQEIKDPAKADVSKTRLKSVLNPLAKVLRVPVGEPFYVPALLIKILPDLSLDIDIALEEGDELRVLRGDWEILLNRLRTTPEKAMAQFKIDKEKVLFVLDSFCCGTHYVIPATERLKSPQILKEAIGNVPFIVTCACGIQTPEPSIGNVYTSLGNGILMFSEK